jgi:hypothetical protein
VLIISEGRNDEFMLKPIIQAMLSSVGMAHASVGYSSISKRRQGVRYALNPGHIREIITQNPMVDLFLLCVDRDGEAGRKEQLTILEQAAEQVLTGRRILLAENAWQEIEVWVLAGHQLPRQWKRKEIRAEPNAKERYFEPYAQQRGVFSESPGEGRKTLAQEAAGRYRQIRQRCQEVEELEGRIKNWLTTRRLA